jgi:hypothetical protein
MLGYFNVALLRLERYTVKVPYTAPRGLLLRNEDWLLE